MNTQKEEKILDSRLVHFGQVLSNDLDIISPEKKSDPHAMVKIIGLHMRTNDVIIIDINFSGEGDSGDVEYIEIKMKGDQEVTSLWAHSHGNADDPLWNILYEWAHAFLNTCQTDWYNNEGGNGHLTFTVDESTGEGRFDYVINYNETISQEGESGEEEF